MRHFNIPVFIPELACPFRCVFCNQYSISGIQKAPSEEEVIEIIESHLSTLPQNQCIIEVAFFGGSFTGLSISDQNRYLSVVIPYIDSGRVNGIRISTRPDYISNEILDNLKKYCVSSIELGAQSMNNSILEKAGRGHKAEDTYQASRLILDYGFELGLQMMVGLPGDNENTALESAEKISETGAHTTRIYPCLVIRGTDLEVLYNKGLYNPLSLEGAVELSAKVYRVFEKAHVKVLRIGLHPSEAFNEGGSLIAGPFHPAFGEMVKTRVWQYKIQETIKQSDANHESIRITFNSSQLNAGIGHKAENRKWLMKRFKFVEFVSDPEMKKNEFHAYTY